MPKGFGDFFVANGWNETKLSHDCQTPQITRWIGEQEIMGRDVKAERRNYLVETRKRKVKDFSENDDSYRIFTGNADGSNLIARVKPHPSIDDGFDELNYG